MTKILLPAAQILLALLLAPLLPGLINRVKAFFAGRRGRPLLQSYRDIAKLLRKGAVYSRTVGWVFRAGPVVGTAAAACALTLLPWGGTPALLAFEGDLILLAYLLGLMRFFTVLAALDTGSAFEGMGASREAWFSALAEPALLLALAAVARDTGSLSLSAFLPVRGAFYGAGSGAALLLAAGAAYVVYLAENARVPVDDPDTHLELTMIHEVMVLDHGGPDFGLIQYGASLKLWVLGAVVAGMLFPSTGSAAWDTVLLVGGELCLAAVTGIVESLNARLKMVRVPQLLICAAAMAALSLALMMTRGMA